VSFSITASNKHGPIRLVRKTVGEAFDLAMSYRRKGFDEIRVANILSGEVFTEPQIVEGRLPVDPVDTPPASLPGKVTVLRLPG